MDMVKRITLNETALFLMDHTDWQSMLIGVEAYLSAVYRSAEGRVDAFLDKAAAEQQILELHRKARESADWNIYRDGMDSLYWAGKLPGRLCREWLEILKLLEEGDAITGMIDECYLKEDRDNAPVRKVCALLGEDALREIVAFALSIASTDDEFVYASLRERYRGAPWYRERASSFVN